MTNSKYTYAQFAEEVMELSATLQDKALAERLYTKAQDLLTQQQRKAEYNATHPKKNVTKGASAGTQEKANKIAPILTANPMTSAEINTALGTDYTPLQIANAVKYIEGVKTCKVIRTTTNAKGLTAQKEYTAYSIG